MVSIVGFSVEVRYLNVPAVTADDDQVGSKGGSTLVRRQVEHHVVRRQSRRAFRNSSSSERLTSGCSSVQMLGMANVNMVIRRTRREATTHDAEWLGGRLRLPAYVLEDEPFRPELVSWLELPSGLLVGHDLVGAEGDGALARALEAALHRHTPGAAREPGRLRVADHADAAELRRAFGERFDIEVAPTPELDAVLDEFVASMPEGDEEASYLEGGRVSVACVARMFEAAALLYRAAPWKVAFDSEVLRLDIPVLGVEGACVSIIGALGQSLGLIVFPSLLAYERFGAAAEQAAGRRSIDLGGPVLSLDFWPGREVPKPMRREIAAHGWTTAMPNAVPVVTHRDRNGVPRPLAEHDVRIAAECAFAVASFFARHRKAFGGAFTSPSASRARWTTAAYP